MVKNYYTLQQFSSGGENIITLYPHLTKKRLATFLRRNVLRSLPSDTVVTATTIEFFPRPASEISEHLNAIPNRFFQEMKTTV